MSWDSPPAGPIVVNLDVEGDADYLNLLEVLRELHVVKSRGYGSAREPFANFQAIARMSGEPAWRYPRRRALEKIARMEALEAQGRFEELEEEHLDAASLLLCAEALRRQDARGEGQRVS